MVIRGALSALLVAALAGCTGLFGSVDPSGAVNALEKLAGVAAVESSSSDPSLEAQGVLNLYVTTTDDVTRDDITTIVETWWGEAAKVDGTASLNIERPGIDGQFDLTTHQSTEVAVAAAEEWFDLTQEIDGSTFVTSVVETRIAVGPGGPASVLAVLDALALVPSSENVVISGDDATFSGYLGAPDATAVAALEALKLPYSAAGEYGSLVVSVTQSTTPLVVAVDFAPDSLSTIPSRDVAARFADDPMYSTVLMVLDAVPASTGATLALSVYGNDLATLRASDCTLEGDFGADLWTYWAAC